MRTPGGQEYRRNRRHLRKAPSQPAAAVDTEDDDNNIITQPVEQAVVEEPSETLPQEFPS